jgi:PBSX family phage terminase large subunit
MMTNELRELLPYLTPQEIGEIYSLAHPALKTTLKSVLQWQYPALHDQSFTILLSGSAGGGKSRTGLEIVNKYLQIYPGATGLMMRKAREWTEKSIVPFFKQSVIKGLNVAEHKKGDRLFQFANGSVLYYAGMKDDDQRESVRSIGGEGGLDIALFEEANAFEENDYNEILGRMRGTAGSYRQVILMTNPDAPNHWINRRLIIGRQATVYYSGAKDNPFNPPDYIDHLNQMTGILYERLVLGRWVQAEGAIFDNFSVEFNVTEESDYNPELPFPVAWGCDDGYAQGEGQGTQSYHPRVILLGQDTPTGGVNIFAEYYVTGELSDRSIDNVLAWPYPVPETAYIDSSAKELQLRIWAKEIQTVMSTHRVSEGIKNLRRLICDGNGVRLLKIHPRCVNLIRELQSVRYDPNSTVVDVGEPKPLKIDDHGPDALRYRTWHLRYGQ